MGQFKVKKTFTLSGRSPVFLQGEIETGVVKVGDTLHLPWNSSVKLEGKICAIEFSDSLEVSFVCLGIECSSKEEQAIWLGMDIGEDEIIEVRSNTKQAN